jgi:threonine dehydrogenase-like Zn-dependent dehydrogenase
MKAIHYSKPRNFRYEDVATGPDEVLIRVRACGLCGTHLHIHEGEFLPNLSAMLTIKGSFSQALGFIEQGRVTL